MQDIRLAKKILIVDDDEDCAKLLTLVIRQLALVEMASDGSKGLEMLAKGYYDLIISDIDMPVMNGIDFFKEAKKSDLEIGKRIIFFTASYNPEKISYLKENNLVYLQKPTSLKVIRETVTNMLNKSYKRVVSGSDQYMGEKPCALYIK